jgi:hypothetical protein
MNEIFGSRETNPEELLQTDVLGAASAVKKTSTKSYHYPHVYGQS